MTRIDFHSNVADTLLHACKLVRKAWAAGNRIVLVCADGQVLSDLERALWSFSPTEFIPHVPVNDPLASQTPVLLSDGQTEPPVSHHQVLINLNSQTPAFFSRFERLIEIVGQDDDNKTAGRQRFKYYRDRGYALAHHDFSGR
jgi:DNA polymerase-3 subunit chi